MTTTNKLCACLPRHGGRRRAFEGLLTRQPSMCKAWVSYAQMEKRSHVGRGEERWQRCRSVLQRGLAANPTSACLVQVRHAAAASWHGLARSHVRAASSSSFDLAFNAQ